MIMNLTEEQSRIDSINDIVRQHNEQHPGILLEEVELARYYN